MKNQAKTVETLRSQKNQNESFKRCTLRVAPKMKRMWERRWTLVKVTWWWIRLGGHTWSLAVWFSELGCQYWRNNLHKRHRRRGRGWHHTLGQWLHPLKHSLRRRWRAPGDTREDLTGSATLPDTENKSVKDSNNFCLAHRKAWSTVKDTIGGDPVELWFGT